jgi:hypothetical protein
MNDNDDQGYLLNEHTRIVDSRPAAAAARHKARLLEYIEEREREIDRAKAAIGTIGSVGREWGVATRILSSHRDTQ